MKMQTNALKLADQLEMAVSLDADQYNTTISKAVLLECVGALRGELPELPESLHPFTILAKELDRRLHPATAHGLSDTPSVELIELTTLAERLESVRREQVSRREEKTMIQNMAANFGPMVAAAVAPTVASAVAATPRLCVDCVNTVPTFPKRECSSCMLKAASGPRAVEVEYSVKALVLHLSTGRTIEVPWNWSLRLSMASPDQRCHMRLIGNGVGIHWPEIDEDLFVSAIVDLYDQKKTL
jgi:Protein of unknown function (DUF2442)